MPELPEAEHARRRFLALTAGRTIEDARALDRIVVPQAPSAWRKALVGRKVCDAERIGKNVLVHLSGRYALWFHLGMSGRIIRRDTIGEAIDPATGLPRWTRWWLSVRGATVCLADPRRLGRCAAGPVEAVRARARLEALGPDALAVESAAALRARVERARGPIKTALMDQRRIAGIGNIQAVEALWLAKIHPETPVTALGSAAWERLYGGIRESLARTLAAIEGKDEPVYLTAGGANSFLVYGRAGEPCPRCSAPIAREVARGRASYICPRCQQRRA
jgi:formamidopyrimidine-DNA glycosylase